MNANAFSLYLPDFARRLDRPAPTAEMQTLEPPTPAEDPAKLLAEAHERGRREGLATARAEFERARAADLVRYDERLIEERQRWTADESERLSGQITMALQEVEAGLVSSVARVLMPFVADSIRRAALDELSETLTAVLASGGDARTLVIRGPDDLIEPLKKKLGAYADAIEFRSGEGSDILATVGETVVETQIGAWLARLAAAVE